MYKAHNMIYIIYIETKQTASKPMIVLNNNVPTKTCAINGVIYKINTRRIRTFQAPQRITIKR